jgi:hypothetical protein
MYRGTKSQKAKKKVAKNHIYRVLEASKGQE